MNSKTHSIKILEELKKLLNDPEIAPSNYARNLLIEKKKYIQRFIKNEPFPPFEVEIQMSSTCNLQCRWCIGATLQREKKIVGLANNLNKETIDNVIEGIINFKEDELGIEIVKFSGFIGEPLMKKDATIKAIRTLIGAGFKVGLFTNGVLMTEDTWTTLANMYYINISLDAGPYTYFWLKESPTGRFTKGTFRSVIDNIKGLGQKKKERRSSLNITVSYVVVPGNHEEVYNVVKTVKEAGADGIRFKCDISDSHVLSDSDSTLDEAFEQLYRAKNDFEDGSFTVRIIHSREDVKGRKYQGWKYKNGCLYQNFLATVGSDGNLYLCDHNTMHGAIPLGSVIDKPFKEVWNNKDRRRLVKMIPIICRCRVCPPFGNQANFVLSKINELKKTFTPKDIADAISELK